ncbi:MAG: peptide deformylase [bacterium]
MAKVLKILTLPHYETELRQISKPIALEDLSKTLFRQLLANMARTMIKKDGIGLAAPQIGQFLRLAVINTKTGPIWLINPEIIKKSTSTVIDEEGCLSIPGYYAKVKRHKEITCKFMDHQGLEAKIEASGLLARAIQHEIDHLDGILFIDRMEKKNNAKS